MLLNIHSDDTDNDGIKDKYDTNPRFVSKINEDNELYNLILNLIENKHYFGRAGTINLKMNYCNNIKNTKIEKTNILINDDELLKHICPDKERVIILTKNEYLNYIKQNQLNYGFVNFSLYKCSFIRNKYKLTIFGINAGETYILTYKNNNIVYNIISEY